MQWIESSVELLEPIDAAAILKKVELALRNCYKSENLIGEGSAEKLIRGCIGRGHEAPLEHAAITYRVICDRGVSHEWVRHRLASYCQESTRYCNYTKDKFGNELTFIYPWWYSKNMDAFEREWFDILKEHCQDAENAYTGLLLRDARPEEARAILPNCLKTDLVCTMNLRELRNFFKLRTTPYAHPDIRKLAKELLQLLRENGLGVFFEDIDA